MLSWLSNACYQSDIEKISYKRNKMLDNDTMTQTDFFSQVSSYESHQCMQQGHMVDLVADMNFAKWNNVMSFYRVQDEHAKPMEEDTALLHSIVLIYADLCTFAHTTLSQLCSYSATRPISTPWQNKVNNTGVILTL